MSEWNWANFQKEQAAWALKNFGKQEPYEPLLGFIEERGELLEADSRYSMPDIIDAVGDCMVFLSSFLTHIEIDLSTVVLEARSAVLSSQSRYPNVRQEEHTDRLTLQLIGQLSHSYLKMVQKIRGGRGVHLSDIRERVISLVEGLFLYCMHKRIALDACTQKTWERVSKRDWKKDAFNGGEPLP